MAETPQDDTGWVDVDTGAFPDPAVSRRGLIVAGIATGAAVVWSAPFPFASAVIGQGVAQAAGPTGPTGPTGPGEPTGATGTAVPVAAAGTTATGGTTSLGGTRRKATLRLKHTATSRRVRPGQWFGQTVVVTARGASIAKVRISMPTPKGLVRVAGKATRSAALVRPGHSLRLQTVYVAKPEAVGRVIALRPRLTVQGAAKAGLGPIHVTVLPPAKG